jgi:hypothetical protein
MKRHCCALLLISSAALGQGLKLEPWREKALQNALRGFKPQRVDERLTVMVEAPLRCSIPLVVVPADPRIDPKMVLKPAEPYPDRMPTIKGLPPCPGGHR